MSLKRELIRAREQYIEILRREVLGPGSEFDLPDKEHELISSDPTQRYSVGILYPQGIEADPENDNENATVGESVDEDDEGDEAKVEVKLGERNSLEEEADNLDEEISMASQYSPSSMGMTFIVNQDVAEIKGCLEFGTYRKVKDAGECKVPFRKEDAKLLKAIGPKVKYDEEKEILILALPLGRKDVKEIIEKIVCTDDEKRKLKNVLYRLADYYREGMIREPHTFDFTVGFKAGNYSDEERNAKIDGTSLKITALKADLGNGLCSVTIMLTNEEKSKYASANNSVFQPKITINSEDNDFEYCEMRPEGLDEQTADNEEQSLELLYRNKKNYAKGLGVSVDWNINENGKGYLWTEFMPESEIPPMDFDLPEGSELKPRDFSMKYLSDLSEVDKKDKLAKVKKLVDLYAQWIKGLEEMAKSLDARFAEAAQRNIENCKKACERMYAGIETLQENDEAYEAFELANRAMFMQRVHLRMRDRNKAEDGLPGNEKIAQEIKNIDYEKEVDDETARCWWRPFQIAFILMDIVSIVDEKSTDREIVDLIWFPTGGGKTEAYLGLTAFTIFYRRIVYPQEAGGTAIIMRYTLRLLTAQQFNRASTLICACEYMRKNFPSLGLGDEPITIGLWIGGEHVPNRNNEAKRCLDGLGRVGTSDYELKTAKERHNKFQVLECPWCGTKMTKEWDDEQKKIVGQWGYEMSGSGFYMHCTNDCCPFRRALPIQIIDEELYKNPPTLLFGTVDKFAMMTWKKETGAFFGARRKNRAPELIIQDELHLISGSLGTIVGLYESAVDILCESEGLRPKVVASTATIRRAEEQCSNLYDREVAQFPAPGLNAEDSFFAREKLIDHDNEDSDKLVFGRKYVGVMPAGKTKVMMENRILAALLQRLYSMHFEKDEEKIKDALWTITMYFGSLRDLGKASTLIGDDVKDFIVRTANKIFEKRRLWLKIHELTSRVTTTDLNVALNDLETKQYLGDDNLSWEECPTSVVLATNMISVGIDVARLNVMLMVGQPKLTSEYIQASSRVGRALPGTVFVQYDSTKSRDRSHYESFKSYHDSFYRFVEPTAVTPFSHPARERALHAVLVALFRQMAPLGVVDEKEAIHFEKSSYRETIEQIKHKLIKRAESVNRRLPSSAQINIDNMGEEIDNFFDEWDESARLARGTGGEVSLCYGAGAMMNEQISDNERFVLAPFAKERNNGIRRTLTSMRNVDKSIKGKIIIEDGSGA